MADTTLLQPVEITAVRAQDKTPIAKTNLGKQEIEKQNTGMDLPFIFIHTLSLTVSSDFGNGIGYTYFRIRGSDASILIPMNRYSKAAWSLTITQVVTTALKIL